MNKYSFVSMQHWALYINCLTSIVVQHLMFLYGWQWNAAQQHAQNALLHSQCNNGYAKMLQCYVICIQSIFLECHCDWTTQGTQVRDGLTYTMTFFQKLCKVLCKTRMRLITGQNHPYDLVIKGKISYNFWKRLE